MFITFPYRLVHDKKNQAMTVQRDRSLRCKCEMRVPRGESGLQVFCWRERVSGILLKRESPPGTNVFGGHDRSNHHWLSMYYTAAPCSTWHYTLLL